MTAPEEGATRGAPSPSSSANSGASCSKSLRSSGGLSPKPGRSAMISVQRSASGCWCLKVTAAPTTLPWTRTTGGPEPVRVTLSTPRCLAHAGAVRAHVAPNLAAAGDRDEHDANVALGQAAQVEAHAQAPAAQTVDPVAIAVLADPDGGRAQPRAAWHVDVDDEAPRAAAGGGPMLRRDHRRRRGRSRRQRRRRAEQVGEHPVA